MNLLLAPVLTATLRRVIDRTLRNKARTVSALVSHFLSVCSEYALLEDRRLLEVMQSVLVPPGCIRTCEVMLAACVEGIYGKEVGTALCLPTWSTSVALNSVRPRANITPDWLSLPVR